MNHPIIQTSSGLVQGVLSEHSENIVVYKGLPFAASTAGENRWRAPQPAPSWNGIRIADTVGHACPQLQWGSMDHAPSAQSEDCLSLNIWTPASASSEKFPVFVWIYGGRFGFGAGSDPAYDGFGLASKGMIVVTLNYRVGILGFLATPELSEESGHNASGNYGILDQLAALTWVKENISAFGGDPSKVTIGGQSAGGASAGIHTFSPLSRGLFRSSINQSGFRYPRDPLLSGLAPAYRTKEKAEAQGAAIVKEKGASNITELRKLSLDILLEGNNKNDDQWGNPPFYRPCIDGYIFPYNYEGSLKLGTQSDIPILVGHNADEGGTYADPLFDSDDFESCAQQKYGPLAQKFLELYPLDNVKAQEAWNEAARDNSRVTVSLWADEFHKHSKSPVFGYIYTHAPPPRQAKQATAAVATSKSKPKAQNESSRSQYTYNKAGPDRGVFHGAEIPFVFNNLAAQDGYAWSESDKAVAEIMSSYWANFIKSGDPNGEGLPEFVSTDREKIMRLGVPKDCSSIPLTENLERTAFWREHLATQNAW